MHNVLKAGMGMIAAKKKAAALVMLVNIILTPVVLKQYPAYSCNENKNKISSKISEYIYDLTRIVLHVI